jgi:superfamily I DNA/RNA helicase
MAKHLIFGAAGTGKTTRLLSILGELFNKGYAPEDICFCTYSRAAAHEAIERATLKFGFDKKDIPYFGTMHSICYRRFFLGKKLIGGKQKSDFFFKVGLDYELIEDDEDMLTNEPTIDKAGNTLLNFYDKLRIYFSRDISSFTSEQEFKEFSQDVPNMQFTDLFSSTFNAFGILLKYEQYKRELDVIDYVDMILEAHKKKLQINTKILIIDEFQDLSPLQYNLYKLWQNEKEEVYLAGDDDQTIYNFICANSRFFLEERKNLKKEDGDEENEDQSRNYF